MIHLEEPHIHAVEGIRLTPIVRVDRLDRPGESFVCRAIVLSGGGGTVRIHLYGDKPADLALDITGWPEL